MLPLLKLFQYLEIPLPLPLRTQIKGKLNKDLLQWVNQSGDGY